MEHPSSHLLRPFGLVTLLTLPLGYFLYFLAHFRYLPGADAYYYALQTQSLLDSGHLKVPDTPVIYYLLASLCRAGLPVEVSFKIVLTAIYALYNAGLSALIIRLKYATWPIAVMLSIFGTSVVAFHTVEFPRLSLGLATVPIWFLLLVGAKKGRLLWLALMLVGCSVLHEVLPFLVLTFVLTVAMGRIRVALPWTEVFSAKRLMVALLSCVLFAFAIATIWPGFALRVTSLRFGIPGLASFFRNENSAPTDLKVVVLTEWLLLALLLLFNLQRSSTKWRYLTVATLGIPLWPGGDPSLFGLSGRLAVLFVFLATPLAIILWDEMSDQNLSFLRTMYAEWILALAVIGMTVILPVRLNTYRTLLASYDYSSYEQVVADLRHDQIFMLIAQRGLDFFYSYRLRRDAFHFDPEPGWERTNVWRVALRVTPEEMAYYSPTSCLWGETARAISGTDYLLVREDCWEQFRANVSPKDNPDLYIEVWEDSENPSQTRPEFLRTKHRGSDKDLPVPSGE